MTTSTAEELLTGWQDWHDEREAAAAAPHGLTSVVGTHWLGTEPVSLPTVAGTWAVDGDDRAVVSGLPASSGSSADTRTLAVGETLDLGGVQVRAMAGARGIGVRVFDPEADTRTAFLGIDTFPADPDRIVEATYTAHDPAPVVTIDHADGSRTDEVLIGQVTFDFDGRQVVLGAFDAPEGRLHISFADATSGGPNAAFRFLTLDAPDASGHVTVDLNRAYLPPSTFAAHYLCPLPPAGNRLDVPIAAGERRVQRRG
ncbi:DUF1684 domain-containing protein [Gordonia sp. DT219]|uniref:DUF1684 domain-containing protein n=1 Tax=Gordonia sp. DT219 TaxID=3416658 RepID=UPI003CEF25F6